MSLLLDTNVLVYIIRVSQHSKIIQFLNPNDLPIYISVVSEAEIKFLALQHQWGSKRLDLLETFLDQVNIVEINQSYVNAYAEIDAYSQRLHKSFDNYSFDTPRNMGKNDLWIASLASLLSLELVTTDNDFNHLHKVFFDVRYVAPIDFKTFF